jgi:hypothetical protein
MTISALPERQHVQAEPVPHDPEQQHGFEGERNPPLFDIAQRAPRRMANMQNVDGVSAHPVKNPEGIANDGNDADVGTLRDTRSRFRCAANAVNNIDQAALDGFGYRRADAGCIIGRNPVEISESPTRIDEFYAERNFAKAALISASVATSPPSIEAIAASMICNSSWVAR